MTFAASAARLAGLAARLLGWRPQEFWGATPAELALSLGASLGQGDASQAPPTRAEIARMIEREADARPR